MSVLLAGGVAGIYIAGVFGLHRLNVWRMRRTAGGFPVLYRLDWDTLLAGLPPSPVLNALREGAGSAEIRAQLETTSGFSGGEARWLKTLSYVGANPDQALARLESADLQTVAELYLSEHLRLMRQTHVANLELAVFASKRRLRQALLRFGEHPALFYVRALASSLLGFNNAVVDDLARAVYFSRQAPFYVKAVLETPYIGDVRPALVRQCSELLEK